MAVGHAITDSPALRLSADGQALRPRREGGRWMVAVPARATALRLVSRRWVPAWTRAAEDDTRRLGVALAALRLDGRPVGLDDPRLSSGWHAVEDGWRWTDGDAGIVLAGARLASFTLALSGSYWQGGRAA
jgi:hypothetical protein